MTYARVFLFSIIDIFWRFSFSQESASSGEKVSDKVSLPKMLHEVLPIVCSFIFKHRVIDDDV